MASLQKLDEIIEKAIESAEKCWIEDVLSNVQMMGSMVSSIIADPNTEFHEANAAAHKAMFGRSDIEDALKVNCLKKKEEDD